MGSILDVKSTGLGGVVKDIKRHSNIKVPKVSHMIKKSKGQWDYKKDKPKNNKIKTKVKIKDKKMKVRVDKNIKRYDKYGDRVY